MQNLKKIVSLALAILLVFTAAPLGNITLPDISITATAADLVDSGTCGENLTWTLDSDGVLTISGTGAMTNFTNSYATPWNDFKKNIKSVIIESGVESIGNNAFYNLSNLSTINIANTVTSIGNSVFTLCKSLESIALPDSLTEIGSTVFNYCEALQSIVLPANLTTLPDHTFTNCTSLTDISFPQNLHTIGDYAFHNCQSLQTITIPSTVTTIGTGAFWNCSALTAVYLPLDLTDIDVQQFKGCDSLQSITIPAENTAFCTEDGVLYNKNKTVLLYYPAGKADAEFTVPESVVEIGGYAFYNCKNLITVIVPEGSLTSIDSNAFRGCSSLTSIILPVELKTIGTYAFADCDALTDIYYTGSEAQWNEITIWSNGDDAVANAEKHYNYCFHKVTEEIPAVDATCTETGLTAGIKCTKCGETLTAQTETPANGHEMGVWYVAEAATCTKAGTEQRDCANCDYFETNEITATGHTPAQAVIENEVAADCSNDGSYETVIYCSICTAELSRETTVVPADGHAMGDWYETKAATCSEAGKEQSDCANCDYFETRETAKTAHTEKEIAGYASTCTETGLTDGCVCTVCGETLTAQTEIPAAGHSEKIIPGVASTCTTKGLTDGKQCTVCGETIKAQQSVGKLMHKDSDNDGECDYGCGYAFDESSESDMPDDSEESKPVGKNSLRIILRVLADMIDIFVTILKFLNRA